MQFCVGLYLAPKDNHCKIVRCTMSRTQNWVVVNKIDEITGRPTIGKCSFDNFKLCYYEYQIPKIFVLFYRS